MAPTEGEEEMRNNNYLERERRAQREDGEGGRVGCRRHTGGFWVLEVLGTQMGSNPVSAALCKLSVFSVPRSWREYPTDKGC